jgi:DNA gyrase/topoisomerase IV subunit A
MTDVFKEATRTKLRFTTSKGKVTTEDLWDLPMTVGAVNLNDIAKALHDELGKSKFSLGETAKKDLVTELKFNIVKCVFDTKTKEIEDRENIALKKEQKEKIIDALADKEADELKGMSKKDLKKQLKKLS